MAGGGIPAPERDGFKWELKLPEPEITSIPSIQPAELEWLTPMPDSDCTASFGQTPSGSTSLSLTSDHLQAAHDSMLIDPTPNMLYSTPPITEYKTKIGDIVRMGERGNHYGVTREGSEGEVVELMGEGIINVRWHLVTGEDDWESIRCYTVMDNEVKVISHGTKRKKATHKKATVKIAKISTKIQNMFATELNDFDYRQHEENDDYPTVFILGGNKSGTIRDVYRVKNYDGCENMIGVRTADFTDAMILFAHKGLSICGLARIGKFDIEDDTDRGTSLKELTAMAPNAYVISYGFDGFIAERYDWHKRSKVELTYKVVR